MRRKKVKMNSKPNSKIIILLTLGIVFGLSLFITATLNSNVGISDKFLDDSDDNNLNNENLKISAVSGKIHIINNSGWVAFRSAGNCTGNGTYSEPYVIEDLVIDGGGSGSCILIENSDVYFKIENCTVSNSGGYLMAGIKLANVIYAQITGNTANNNNGQGIRLSSSDYNNVSGNTANNNNGQGIRLSSSDYNNVSGNNADYNIYGGMGIYSSKNNTIMGNTANNNVYYDGIELGSSNNNIISGNTANNNGLDGIHLWSSDNNTISGNTLIGNYRCYSEFSDCEGNVFENNDCENRIDLTILYLIVPLTILFIGIPLTMTGMIVYERRKHSTFPKYGTISLIFDLLGLLILSMLGWAVISGDFRSLIATPFTIVGTICGYVGYKSKRDTTRVLEILGALFGIVLLFISIFPLLAILAFIGIF